MIKSFNQKKNIIKSEVFGLNFNEPSYSIVM